MWFFLRKIIGKVPYYFKSSCLCFCKICGNETLGGCNWQYIYSYEKHIYSHFYSEPPNLLLKFEFNETCKMNC